jgi:hypothetical protein
LQLVPPDTVLEFHSAMAAKKGRNLTLRPLYVYEFLYATSAQLPPGLFRASERK